MGYKIYKFQNKSDYAEEKSTITIDDSHPDWNKVYNRWLSGKAPSDSIEWNKGVIACSKEK